MRLLRSFLYAFSGIKYCFQREQNFRIHIAAIALVIVAGVYFSVSNSEWLFITLCCTLVVSMEMLNTAMEKMCDLVSKDVHPLIKIIKDVSAGAVMICAAGSAVTGSIIFIPKIIQLLQIN